ncbi:MAG: DUF4301 family protein [Flavobacteriaceae bacterium]|nr:DUF4301 family protein [Flavobacteriaceae bacterium]
MGALKKLSKEQKAQLKKLGKSLEQTQRHLNQIVQGIRVHSKVQAATVENGGIKVLTHQDKVDSQNLFNAHKGGFIWTKFVPASGAASRMFSEVFQYLDQQSNPGFILDDYLEKYPSFELFAKNLNSLAFYSSIDQYLNKKYTSFALNTPQKYLTEFCDTLVHNKRVGFSHLPKGLIPFFKTEHQSYTPFQAHILESVNLFGIENKSNLHFTIDERFKPRFQSLIPLLNQNIKINFSSQCPSTDTPVMSLDNHWLTDEKGDLHFRKGGHGALLKNLNAIDSDFVLIKNIDNILVDNHNEAVIQWLKVLCGTLMKIKSEIDASLLDLDQKGDAETINRIIKLIRLHFDPQFDIESHSLESKQRFLEQYLNKPLRVCAMIKSSKSAGGGPFWHHSSDRSSVQIFEEIEFQKHNQEHQQEASKTQFINPVLIACSIKDRFGKAFDLEKFSNPNRYMIVHKTMGNQQIKAIEWPGLWNGGMADWNSVFIDVPKDVFRPVKKVHDLIHRKAQN